MLRRLVLLFLFLVAIAGIGISYMYRERNLTLKQGYYALSAQRLFLVEAAKEGCVGMQHTLLAAETRDISAIRVDLPEVTIPDELDGTEITGAIRVFPDPDFPEVAEPGMLLFFDTRGCYVGGD